MFYGIDVVRSVMAEDVALPRRVPYLAPHEIPKLLLRQPLLPGVVDSLHHCGLDAGFMQEVGHCGAVSEGVHRPPADWLHAENVGEPLVPW